MKSFFRRIAFCLVIFIFASSTYAGAVAPQPDNTQFIISQVSKMLPLLCDLSDVESPIYLGDKVSAYHTGSNGNSIISSDYDVYPILANSKLLALANVTTDSDSQISVTCTTSYVDELNEFFDTFGVVPFALVYTDAGAYVSTNSIAQYWLKEDSTLSSNLTANLEMGSLLSQHPITIGFSALSTQAASAIDYDAIRISNVANGRCTTCPEGSSCRNGLCWAASIAMIVNYYSGTSYTAQQIHQVCPSLTDAYHDEEKLYLTAYGLTANGPYSNSFTFSNVKYHVNNETLMLLDLQYHTDNTDSAHNVVAYGYFNNPDEGARYFYFMDPNNSGNSICAFPSSGSVTTITTSGRAYTLHCYITACE